MKIIKTLILVLFFSYNLASAQDTLYIYRAGVVVTKRPVSEIDSITFSKKYTIPVQQTITDIDGNVYHTVKIGSQTWMVENLKTTKYSNGDLIGTTSSSTKDLTYEFSPKYQWAYDGDENNVAKYGRLYTWHVVNDSRKIAPKGWHVSSDADWTTLQNYLIANGYNYDGTKTGNNIAKSLSSTSLWLISSNSGAIGNDLTKNNTSGFSSVPGGYRGFDGMFYILNWVSDHWTSTENSANEARMRFMGYTNPDLASLIRNKNYGFSVRCVKDTLSRATIITTQISTITKTTAVCGGNITFDGGDSIIARGVCWSTSINPTVAKSKTSDGAGTGAFSSSVTGLIADTTYYIRAYATNSVGTAYGNQVSFKTIKTDSVTVTDIDGNDYHTVTIGTQVWMKENLKVTKFSNGDLIPNVSNNSEWSALMTGGYCWYNNEIVNKSTYGALYNWYTVADSRQIAPEGWHVATDADFTILTSYLGGENVSGNKMKETGISHWLSPNNGATNESGFSGLPGGLRNYSDGTFRNIGSNGYYWSNTQSDSIRAWDRELFYDQANSFRYNFDSKLYGLSVRCVKDTVIDLPTVHTIKGLVLYLPLDGNTNDLSKYENNGINNGASPTSDRFGRPDRAMNFNGNNTISVPGTEELDLTASKTVSCWIYIPSSVTQLWYPTIIHKYEPIKSSTYSLQLTDYFGYNSDQHKLDFFYASNDTNYQVRTRQLYTDYKDQWIHVACTYDTISGDSKIYFNGMLSDSVHFGKVIANSSNSTLYIGGAGPGTYRYEETYFKGLLDEIRIYNRALTGNEISLLYKEEE